MAKTRAKIKGRQESGRFMALPFCILESENFLQLSATATRLLIDLFHQHNGRNNGDFQATWNYMRCKRNWKSEKTLHLAKQELLFYGLIIETKRGGLRSSSRYGVCWLALDVAEDVSVFNTYVKTRVVPNLWREVRGTFSRKDFLLCHKRPKKEKPQKDGTVTPFRSVKRRGKKPSKK